MLVALLGAVACSGEVAIEDWAVRADGVCAQAQAASDREGTPYSPLPGDPYRRLAARSRDEVAQLRELPVPSEQRTAVAEWYVALDRRVEALDNYAKAIDATPSGAAPPDAGRLEETTADASTRALALGLERCGGGVDLATGTTTTTLPLTGAGPAPTTAPLPDPNQPQGFETEDAPG